ncbi:MAG: hypothetical protein JSV51_00745, partial [Candidatus Bathyarchaeota archaeon]
MTVKHRGCNCGAGGGIRTPNTVEISPPFFPIFLFLRLSRGAIEGKPRKFINKLTKDTRNGVDKNGFKQKGRNNRGSIIHNCDISTYCKCCS